mgnify:FL=1
MSEMLDVAVIGGGVIGCAVAYTLSRYDCRVAVLERENDVATGATRANSAIVHAGYDPKPGTLMARLNVEGCAMAPELCARLDVPYENIGSLVLSFSEEDDATLKTLYDRGVQNGVPGLELLDGAQVRAMEPQVSDAVRGALYAPSAGIICPWEYALAMGEVAAENGVAIHLNCAVTGITAEDSCYRITTTAGEYTARYVVNAAGVESAAVHGMVAEPDFVIRPSRGEYYLMDKAECGRAHHVLFQCPSALGKGVLVSPTVDGNLIVGPSAIAAAEPERVNTTADGLYGVQQAAARTLPSINYRNTIRVFAGMRANTDHEDFLIREVRPGFIDLAGIKSPGLSAAPAIGKYCVELLQKAGLTAAPKEDAVATRRKTRFRRLSAEEKARKIAENPLYGRVICRCETVTEGEIVDAIHSPIRPRTVDAIKRRTGAGMGRCQGGFCSPRVVEILSRELGCSPLEIQKDTGHSYILERETKKGAAQA